MKEIKAILNYLINPIFIETYPLNLKKWYIIVFNFLICFTIIFLSAFLSSLVTTNNGDIQIKKITIIANPKASLELYFFIIFILVITEELIFRLGLKYSIFNFTISSSLLISFFIIKLEFVYECLILLVLNSVLNSYLYIFILACIIFYPLLLYIKFLNAKYNLRIIWKNNFKIIFYMYNLIFTFFHLSQIQINNLNIFAVVCFIFPIFIGSLILSQIRMRIGLLYSIIFHFIYNSLFLVR